jgi:hypothetical protein
MGKIVRELLPSEQQYHIEQGEDRHADLQEK